MFPLPITSWIMIALSVVAIGGFSYGRYESNRYHTYRAEIEAQAKAQEAQIESLKKQQTLATQGIEKEYNAKLALIRQYYANGVQSGSSKMPGLSTTSSIADATAIYNILAEQCAETTQQTVSLIDWINAQMGLQKNQ
jgi:hypothetical protein